MKNVSVIFKKSDPVVRAPDDNSRKVSGARVKTHQTSFWFCTNERRQPDEMKDRETDDSASKLDSYSNPTT